eukprot:487729-Rhodomonas_salina.1
MYLAWGLHKLAEFCIGKSEVTSGHGDQKRKVPRYPTVTTVESRVDVAWRVSLRKQSASLERRFDSRLVPGAVDL